MSMDDGFFASSNGAAVVDIPAFFDSRFPDAVAQCVALGLLVSVGTSRDRGAVSVTVTHDGRHRREYFRDSADAADFLGLAVAAVRGPGVGDTGRQAAAHQTPTRRRQKAL
jgi:hypothetical protein